MCTHYEADFYSCVLRRRPLIGYEHLTRQRQRSRGCHEVLAAPLSRSGGNGNAVVGNVLRRLILVIPAFSSPSLLLCTNDTSPIQYEFITIVFFFALTSHSKSIQHHEFISWEDIQKHTRSATAPLVQPHLSHLHTSTSCIIYIDFSPSLNH